LTSTIVSATSAPMRDAAGAARALGATLLAAAASVSLRLDDATPAAVRNCWL